MRVYFFLLFAIVGVLSSCNEEITVGSAILEDTIIDVSFNNTLDIEVKSVIDDTVVTFREGVDSRTFLLGEVNDPSFGFSKSDVYVSTQIILGSIPSFDTLVVDSIIMVFPLDSFGQFGNEDAIHNIEVFQLQEELKVDDDTGVILSSDMFEFGSTAVGQFTGVINHRDSVNLELAANRDSLVGSFPQLRIPMDEDFWLPIITDSAIFNIDNTEAFADLVKGFVIRSTPNDNSIAGLNLLSTSPLSIAIYYSNLDGSVRNNYLIDVAAIRSNQFTHDYSGTSVESSLDEINTEFAYLQTMQGLNLEIDLKSIKDLENSIINKVSLEFFILEDGTEDLDPIQSLNVLFKNNDGILDQISDIDLSNTLQTDLIGGILESTVINGQTVRKYELDITSHGIGIARGDIINSVITIEANSKPQSVTRSIIMGSSNPDFPARLKLVTSNP